MSSWLWRRRAAPRVGAKVVETAGVLCPVCLGARTPCVATVGAERHRIRRCADCCLEFVSPFVRPVAGDSSAVTEVGYIAAMKSQRAELEGRIGQRAAERLAVWGHLLGHRPQRVLDVGAGSGWIVAALASMGIEAVGLELDADLLACAHDSGAPVIGGDICQPPAELEAGSFDVVLSSQTLEHIFEPRRAIDRMAALLRTGGLLHVDVPNGDSWGARVRRVQRHDQRFGAIELPHHQLGYHPRSLSALLSSGGLSVVELLQLPTDDPTFGQVILPTNFASLAAISASRLLGHGYLLVGLARRP
jgi:2-polyprenyl-3-methyl-5-hydroxy-6-metoxy-1,4-benzoquinol methylase